MSYILSDDPIGLGIFLIEDDDYICEDFQNVCLPIITLINFGNYKTVTQIVFNE